jgi:hypothetical protein
MSILCISNTGHVTDTYFLLSQVPLTSYRKMSPIKQGHLFGCARHRLGLSRLISFHSCYNCTKVTEAVWHVKLMTFKLWAPSLVPMASFL